MGRAQSFENESFELYRQIAEDLCLPVDDNLEREVRYELYLSKWIYLERLRESCFVRMNQGMETKPEGFCPEDLSRIQRAMALTREFIRQMNFDALKHGLAVRMSKAKAKEDARKERDAYAAEENDAATSGE